MVKWITYSALVISGTLVVLDSCREFAGALEVAHMSGSLPVPRSFKGYLVLIISGALVVLVSR